MSGYERHLFVAELSFGSGIEFKLTVHIQVFETFRELGRHESEQRFDLPLAGGQIDIHINHIAECHVAVHAQFKLVDSQFGFAEREVHVIQIGSERGVECEVQTVGIGIPFQACADVVGVQFDAYIVPTSRFCRQFGVGERGVDSVLGVHERYLSCLYAQSVHLERLERQ